MCSTLVRAVLLLLYAELSVCNPVFSADENIVLTVPYSGRYPEWSAGEACSGYRQWRDPSKRMVFYRLLPVGFLHSLTNIQKLTSCLPHSDPGNPRTLNSASTAGATVTEESCVTYCIGKGYIYAGVEYSDECCELISLSPSLLCLVRLRITER